MRKLSIFITCLLLSISTNSFAARKIINIVHWRAKNGMPVYFVRRMDLPMLDIATVFNAGSSYDGKQYGISSLVNNMLGQGAKDKSADQIAKAFDQLGAEFSQDSNRDMAEVSLRCLTKPDILEPAVSLFTDVITAPSFPAKAFTRTQKQTLMAIKATGQSPNAIAQQQFFKTVYGHSAYAHPELGTKQSVSQLTRTDVSAFYKTHYVSRNGFIVMVGALPLKQARHIANQISAGFHQGKRTQVPKLNLPKPEAIANHINFPAQQTHIYMGEVAINRINPEYLTLQVGNYTLGGGLLVSRLNDIVREQYGLSYAIFSHFIGLKQQGPFVITLQTKNASAEQAIHLSKKILSDFVAKGPSKKELADAKKNLIGSFPLKLASNSAILANLTNIVFYHLPLNYLDTYRHRVEKIKAKQIKAAFQKYLNPNKMVIISVGGQ